MENNSTLSAQHLPQGAILAERYLIDRTLGSGGQACVYLAKDLETNAGVAVKVMHQMFAQDRTLVQRFLQEAQILSTIHNPNVVQMYDVFVWDGNIISVMEYCPGGSLSDLLLKQPLPQDQIPAFLGEVLNGFEAIHEQKIVHRDIKPGNILYAADGSIKISDFGVAKTPDSLLTQKNQMVGAPQYIAPEIWLGRDVTAAADYYSLGILLFEIACARYPFYANSVEEWMEAHIQARPQSVFEYWEDSPNWIAELVEMLLNKDPAKRICSARAIRVMANPSDTMTLQRVVLDRALGDSRIEEKMAETVAGAESPAFDSDTISISLGRQSKKNRKRNSYILTLSASDLHDKQRKEARRRSRKSVELPLPKDAALIFEVERPSRDVYYFGLFLISLQIMDGILTSRGMMRYGTYAEGNPFLRSLMESFSPNQTLFIVKAFSIMAVVMITLIAKRSKVVRDMIGVLSCIYLFVAILPWAYLLLLS